MHHFDNPGINSSTLFNKKSFGDNPDLHIQIIHTLPNVWSIHGVELSLLAIQEEGITKA
jgi:hypothetical protein